MVSASACWENQPANHLEDDSTKRQWVVFAWLRFVNAVRFLVLCAQFTCTLNKAGCFLGGYLMCLYVIPGRPLPGSSDYVLWSGAITFCYLFSSLISSSARENYRGRNGCYTAFLLDEIGSNEGSRSLLWIRLFLCAVRLCLFVCLSVYAVNLSVSTWLGQSLCLYLSRSVSLSLLV